jgi:hypothetical protein
VADPDSKPATATVDADALPGIPGSASTAHPFDAIPLPAHGFETLDDISISQRAATPAAEVITRAAVLLMSAAAETLGLAPDGEPDLDLDEARRLITALAGLLAASQEFLGEHREPLRAGLKTLQSAFREASSFPDEPGQGPGEQLVP